MAVPLRGGGEGRLNGCVTKEKRTSFNVRKNVPISTKPRGEGAKSLSGRATMKRTFFAASLRVNCIQSQGVHLLQAGPFTLDGRTHVGFRVEF